ncbi:MAG TPA: nucleoside triphosphate pyrophosphatase [Thiobacillaceae bacterium]|nr:nucleoside triphosphate pyrophosphatase [Thiobacillaceae bacterium]
MTYQDNRIYLASQSPRRRELLKQIGAHFEVLYLRQAPGREDVLEIPGVDEAPMAFARRMAREKAKCGAKLVRNRRMMLLPVLGADTLLDLEGEIIGKPRDLAHAREVLQRLSGRAHWVHTGIALAWGERVETRLSSSKVSFSALSAEQIERYLKSGEALDKAGAYGIQGRAAAFIQRIQGSHSGIMGLPLFETAALLQVAGIIV